MGWVSRAWLTLSERQKLAAVTVGGWLGAWALGKLLDYIATQTTSAMPLSVIARFLETYVTNGYVAMLILGAGIVGFGPNILTYLKKIGAVGCINIIFSLFIVFFVVAGAAYLGSKIYSSVFYVPRLYAPPQSMARQADGTTRIFTNLTPAQIEKIFDRNTDLEAHRLLHEDIGKWIAITGVVTDITAPSYLEGLIQVEIGVIAFSKANLTFDKRWAAKLSKVSKNSRIFAVCKLSDGDSNSLSLELCELAPP